MGRIRGTGPSDRGVTCFMAPETPSPRLGMETVTTILMHARVRELVAYGERCGFLLEGMDGRGHYVLTHPNGASVRIACTPGDYRGDDNARAEMRRTSGVTPPRPRAGRGRRQERSGFRMPHHPSAHPTGERSVGVFTDPGLSLLLAEESRLCTRIRRRPDWGIGGAATEHPSPDTARDLLNGERHEHRHGCARGFRPESEIHRPDHVT